jgi:flagellar basal body rod protein FlgG
MEAIIRKLESIGHKDFIVLDELNTPYSGIKITNFKKKYENGNLFKHTNGEKYAIAFFNAFSEAGFENISSKLLENENITIDEIVKIIEENRLFEYVSGSTKKYELWETDDEGILCIKYDNEKKRIVASFTNKTVVNRNYKVK